MYKQGNENYARYRAARVYVCGRDDVECFRHRQSSRKYASVTLACLFDGISYTFTTHYQEKKYEVLKDKCDLISECDEFGIDIFVRVYSTDSPSVDLLC